MLANLRCQKVRTTFGGGGGGGQGGATVLLPTNLSVNAEVAEANGLPFKAFPLFGLLCVRFSSVSSNSKVGFHSSVSALRDNDVISSAKLTALVYTVYQRCWSSLLPSQLSQLYSRTLRPSYPWLLSAKSIKSLFLQKAPEHLLGPAKKQQRLDKPNY